MKDLNLQHASEKITGAYLDLDSFLEDTSVAPAADSVLSESELSLLLGYKKQLADMTGNLTVLFTKLKVGFSPENTGLPGAEGS